MHLGMEEWHMTFLGHCDLDLCPSFYNNCARSISHIIMSTPWKGLETYCFYLHRLSKSRSSSGSTPCECLFVRPSVRNTFGVPSLCNL